MDVINAKVQRQQQRLALICLMLHDRGYSSGPAAIRAERSIAKYGKSITTVLQTLDGDPCIQLPTVQSVIFQLGDPDFLDKADRVLRLSMIMRYKDDACRERNEL